MSTQICTFKNHFIAGLCSAGKGFPIHLWDWLIPQAKLTLNLLHGSWLDPSISAWEQLHGPFDFNHNPIALPGTKVIIHEKPAVWQSWAPHSVDRWYLRPALNSYQCYTIWVTATQAQQICNSLTWLPTQLTMPTASSTDHIIAGLADITKAALLNLSTSSPLVPVTLSQADMLKQAHASTPGCGSNWPQRHCHPTSTEGGTHSYQ